jgi:WXG100 family type VII secretion target
MAGEIAVTPESLRGISEKMKLGAKEVDEILSRLSNHVAPVRSEWTGPAQAYFNAFWDQSQHDASDLRSVLVGLATLTETAATAYEATEQRIAESFGDFRTNPDAAQTNADSAGETLVWSGLKLVDTADVQPTIDAFPGEAEAGAVTSLEGPSESHEILTSDASNFEIATGNESANVETTLIEDERIEVADPSEGASKANGRLPWSRFITKSARSEVGDAVVRPRVPERRFKTSDPALRPGSRLCRLCFTVVSIEPGFIERTATHDYVRCPHCGNSFPVRHGDLENQELNQ